jgi:hypothetical protein
MAYWSVRDLFLVSELRKKGNQEVGAGAGHTQGSGGLRGRARGQRRWARSDTGRRGGREERPTVSENDDPRTLREQVEWEDAGSSSKYATILYL